MTGLRRGFSLLEVLIATAILALVFAYLSGAIVQGGYFQSKAPIYSQAALLLRGIVLDLEAEYAAEGFPENDVTNRRCELPDDTDESYECEYDLEKLDVDAADLGQMAANLMEQMTANVGENGSILQAFNVLAFLFIQGNVPISPLCPATPTEFLSMCDIRTEVIEQNVMGMVHFFPQLISTAAEQTRKLRIRITHPTHKEPVLEVETFIISIPEEIQALTEEGAIPTQGTTPGATPATTPTATPTTGGTTP